MANRPIDQQTEFELLAADELIARRITGDQIACDRGCSWCCNQLIVMTNRNDGITMLAAARARLSTTEFQEVESGLREQAVRIGAMPYEEAETRHWPCPFLRDGECSVYDVRPIPCRTVLSSDANCCKAMMQANNFEDLSSEHQELATEIGERAMRLQFEINDCRTITGAIEMRALLVSLL